MWYVHTTYYCTQLSCVTHVRCTVARRRKKKACFCLLRRNFAHAPPPPRTPHILQPRRRSERETPLRLSARGVSAGGSPLEAPPESFGSSALCFLLASSAMAPALRASAIARLRAATPGGRDRLLGISTPSGSSMPPPLPQPPRAACGTAPRCQSCAGADSAAERDPPLLDLSLATRGGGVCGAVWGGSMRGRMRVVCGVVCGGVWGGVWGGGVRRGT